MRTGMRPKIVAPVFVSVTLLLLLVYTPARSAIQPKPLYAMDTFDNELVAFSLKAQTVTIIGSLGPQASDGGLALAFCPPEGLVPYTIVNPFDPDAQLATVDLRTGAATRVGTPLPSDQTLDIMGMACSRDGILYAIGQFDTGKADFNSLYTIDRVSGQATVIGPTGVTDSRDCCSHLEGTFELTILEATGIYSSFAGGHNHMVDRLHLLANGKFDENCYCIISLPSSLPLWWSSN